MDYKKNIENLIFPRPEPKPEFKAPEPIKTQPTLLVAQSAKPNVTLNEDAAFNELVRRESRGDPLAVNKTSLACGLGQFLPCRKLLDKANINYNAANLTSVAGVKTELAKVPYEIQERLMWEYIWARYGNASKALAFHNANGWY